MNKAPLFKSQRTSEKKKTWNYFTIRSWQKISVCPGFRWMCLWKSVSYFLVTTFVLEYVFLNSTNLSKLLIKLPSRAPHVLLSPLKNSLPDKQHVFLTFFFLIVSFFSLPLCNFILSNSSFTCSQILLIFQVLASISPLPPLTPYTMLTIYSLKIIYVCGLPSSACVCWLPSTGCCGVWQSWRNVGLSMPMLGCWESFLSLREAFRSSCRPSSSLRRRRSSLRRCR